MADELDLTAETACKKFKSGDKDEPDTLKKQSYEYMCKNINLDTFYKVKILMGFGGLVGEMGKKKFIFGNLK